MEWSEIDEIKHMIIKSQIVRKQMTIFSAREQSS